LKNQLMLDTVLERATLKFYEHSAALKRDGVHPATYWQKQLEKMIAMANFSVQRPTILEIGFGTGNEATLFSAQQVRYIGIDYSSQMVDVARAKSPEHEFHLANVYHLEKVVTEPVDCVIAIQVLHHIPENKIDQVLQLIAGRLKTGGVGFFSIRHDFGTGERNFSEPEGTRMFVGYLPGVWISMLQDAGFSVEGYETDTRDFRPPHVRNKRMLTWVRKK
jgi:ubiquinone/menaquinone biosynthesis C-methylase UbiE